MTIDAEQFLITVLRADESARERLMSLLGPGSPLAEVIAQDAVPARLRVWEAARMAGVTLDRFTDVLSGAACPAAEHPTASSGVKPASSAPPGPNDWFAQADAAGAAALDVRPILASGRDPFTDVMQASASVPEDGFLVVDAPFDPAPLRRVLAGKGFTSVGREVEPGHWRICFRRTSGGVAAVPSPLQPGATWKEGGVLHIDVRGMMPPGPLTAILRLIESGEATAIMAHLDRDPAPLYPEIERNGWECVAKQTHGGEVRLILRPRATA